MVLSRAKPACIEIEIGKGVCGTAVANDQVMLVKDVPSSRDISPATAPLIPRS